MVDNPIKSFPLQSVPGNSKMIDFQVTSNKSIIEADSSLLFLRIWI